MAYSLQRLFDPLMPEKKMSVLIYRKHATDSLIYTQGQEEGISI